ncbi:hypothetical protein Tco_1073447 [Tanacetum coccineum]
MDSSRHYASLLRMSSALCIFPLRMRHHHEDRLDLLGEWQKDEHEEYVVLEHRVFVIELDEHEEYVQTYNFLLTHQLEKGSDYQ